MRKALAVVALTTVLTGGTTAVAFAAAPSTGTQVAAPHAATDTNGNKKDSDKTGLWGLLGLLGLGGLAKRKTSDDVNTTTTRR